MTSRPRLTRRALLGGAGAVAVATATTASSAGPSTTPVDVIVVGAGLAGLTAARTLQAAGKDVIVLEARDRVGGRNYDVSIGDGDVVELGGQWIGPGQTKMYELAAKLNVKTFQTYETGKSTYVYGGRKSTYTGYIPPASPAALVEIEATLQLINNLAAGVPADEPWKAQRASEFDAQSVTAWINTYNHTTEARFLIQLAVRGVYGEDASQVSMLDLLAGVTGVGGDMNTLIGDAQSTRFVGGPQQLSKKLAQPLRRPVVLRSEVSRIERGPGFTVTASTGIYTSREVVIAIPKPNIAAIDWRPLLPAALTQLFQRQPMGATTKVEVVYPTPWWRSLGLNGSVVGDVFPLEIVYDNSPANGKQGVLVGFLEGNQSRAFFAKGFEARKAAVLRSLAAYFGPAANAPRLYLEKVWPEDRYALGAYGSFNPPGVLTSLGPEATVRVPGLHFAGADFSAEWPGYMEGAVRSGEKAARAILARP